MRSFFLLLLLTNVALLAWQLLDKDTPQEVVEAPAAAVANQGLVPLAELPLEELPPLREGAEAGLPVMRHIDAGSEDADTRYCGRITRVREVKLRDELLQQIRAWEGSAVQHGSEQVTVVNYWVMLPPYNSSEKAAEAVTILKQRRIRDLFIVRSGEYENAVSLGVFTSRERAEKRYQQIIDLKARLRKPVIELRDRPDEAYWIRYEIRGGEQRQALGGLLQGNDTIKIEEMRCK